MASHDFHPTVLRQYDIRGIIGQTLSAADATAIGRAFGTLIRRDGGTKVAVGYDGRLSSPELEAAVCGGLEASGCTAMRIGRGPTPMLYFACHAHRTDGGIMVTGSHNPPDHNGFKMVRAGVPFFGEDIQSLGRLAATADYESGIGERLDLPVFSAYIERLVADYRGGRGLSAVWDAGNGAAGEVLRALIRHLPGSHEALFAEIDGRFPNHHPDPTEPENLTALIARVREVGADCGIAFDGDGDRIGIVDGKGRILFGDQILMLLSEEILAAQPGATIIADVKASQTLFDRISELGGRPLMYKTGHSLIKSKLKATGAPLAGEMSGHIFFADKFYGVDDALYAGVRFLDWLSRQDLSLAEIVDRLPQPINTPEMRLPCPDETKFQVIAMVADRLKAAGADVIDVDGVRVRTADGWWLLRASNTQAVLVARCEADSTAGLQRLKTALLENLAAAGVSAELPD